MSRIHHGVRIPDTLSAGDELPAHEWNAMVRALRQILEIATSARVQSSATIGVRSRTHSGTLLYQKNTSPAGAGGAKSPCQFGKIVIWTEGEGELAETKTGITGGIVYCGDKNFTLEPYELTLGTEGSADGAWLVWLQFDATAKMDEDGVVIVPGVETSTETDPSAFWKLAEWTPGAQYPDNVHPTAESLGVGTLVVPLGRLVIEQSEARFEPEGCGNVYVRQCSEEFSYIPR